MGDDPRRPFSQIAVAEANRKGEHHSIAAVTFMDWRTPTTGLRRISVRRNAINAQTPKQATNRSFRIGVFLMHKGDATETASAGSVAGRRFGTRD
jgi:hypothetical protein